VGRIAIVPPNHPMIQTDQIGVIIFKIMEYLTVMGQKEESKESLSAI